MSLKDPITDHDTTIGLLTKLRNILIASSTGGQASNRTYARLHKHLSYKLEYLGVNNPIPYEDLDEWRGMWSSGDLPTYDARRQSVRAMIDPLIRFLQEGPVRKEAGPERTGWTRIDRVQDKIRNSLVTGAEEEDFQNTGLLCREIIITLAQTVFDPRSHPVIKSNSDTSKTDVKRMFDRYLAVELRGKSHQEARKYIKSAFDLTNKLQHKRSATYRDAALCAQATLSVVNFIAIVSRTHG